MDLFDLKDHPNTLAPLEPDNFLVLLHNLGSVSSCMVLLASQSGFLVGRFATHQHRGDVGYRASITPTAGK
jgi:hypothetical protein